MDSSHRGQCHPWVGDPELFLKISLNKPKALFPQSCFWSRCFITATGALSRISSSPVAGLCLLIAGILVADPHQEVPGKCCAVCTGSLLLFLALPPQPFRCAHCHYSCNISGSLKRHYNRKHPIEEYANVGSGELAAEALIQQGE